MERNFLLLALLLFLVWLLWDQFRGRKTLQQYLSRLWG